MLEIYTTAWYDAIRDLLNGNPAVEKSAPRGLYRILIELQGDGVSPYVKSGETLLFVIRLDDGKCTGYEEIDSAQRSRDFDFIFVFPASVFEGVAAGVVDPVAVGLKGTIKITGDMRILIRHADLVNVMRDVYAREVDTVWPRGRPPYSD